MEKKFKPFDKVLVRSLTNPKWSCDFYSHYNVEENAHDTVCFRIIKDNNILPYEGNEHLVGTTDSPDEEVRLEEGEWGFFFNNKEYAFDVRDFQLLKFCFININIDRFKTSDSNNWKYAIRFSDFNPIDMEETKAKILCVKGGKVVRYKG